MELDLFLRAGAAILLLLFYASNALTAGKVIEAQARVEPYTIQGFIDSIWPSTTFLIGYVPQYDEKKWLGALIALMYFGPWVSGVGASVMFVVHLWWFGKGYWIEQELIYSFCVSHYVIAAALHAFHLFVYLILSVFRGALKRLVESIRNDG